MCILFMIQRIFCSYSVSGTILDARSVAGNKREQTVILELMCSEERHFSNHEINKMISDGKKCRRKNQIV